MSQNVRMKVACSVYSGPDTSLYPSVGSVGLDESVTALWYDIDSVYIEYHAGSSLKRGFVAKTQILNGTTLNIPTEPYYGKLAVNTRSQSVYYGPDNNGTFPVVGSISKDETVSVLGYEENGYIYIEYCTGSLPKRGYVIESYLDITSKSGLGYIKTNSTNVYSGPAASGYYKSGSISMNETVVLLAETFYSSISGSWYLVEYNTPGYRKRGFIDKNDVYVYADSQVDIIISAAEYAKATRAMDVYYGPGPYFSKIGSIGSNELIGIIDEPTLSQDYYYIEYSYSGGKKRGYVTPTSAIQVPDAPYCTLNQDTNVYYGPDDSIYPTVGTVFEDEVVQLCQKENGWFYIEYMTSSSLKRGYIPQQHIHNYSSYLSQVDTLIVDGGLGFMDVGSNVYAGPNDSYAVIGSVYDGESVTILETEGDFSFIEYSSPSGVKRGFIASSNITPTTATALARLNKSESQVYAGPDDSYTEIGKIFDQELFVVLEQEKGSIYSKRWAYVEYNTSSGRKRGFALLNDITILCHEENLPETNYNNSHLAESLQSQTVYTGPSSLFVSAGSIGTNERVSLLDGVDSEYAYIEYNTTNKAKRGYVKRDTLQLTQVNYTPLSSGIADQTILYGYSGKGRELLCHKIGNGDNAFVAVFGIHGYEDAWAADGEELRTLAHSMIEHFADTQDNWNPDLWSIYIIPTANPDGLLDGWTCNGPGRCSFDNPIDNNRNFSSGFVIDHDKRNYTGNYAFESIEAMKLKELLQDIADQHTYNVLIDVHGWLDETLGNSEISTFYNEIFGTQNHSLTNAHGYLSKWAGDNGFYASLIELPFPSSKADIINDGYSNKLNQATLQLLDQFLENRRVDVTGISIINKPNGALHVGDVQAVLVQVTPLNATDRSFELISSNTNIAYIDASYTLHCIAPGSVVITATSTDGHYTDTMSLVVEDKLSLEAIQIDDIESNLIEIDQEIQLEVHTIPSGVYDGDYIWSSNNTSVASVDNNGLVRGKGVGNVIIQVSTEDDTFRDSISLQVKEKTVEIPECHIVESTFKLDEDTTYQLHTETVPPNQTRTVLWTSSNESVATIDANGFITSYQAGDVTIYLKDEDGTILDSCSGTVYPKIQSIDILMESELSPIDVGESKTVLVSVTPMVFPIDLLEWTLSDSTVASIENGVITANDPGTTTLTISNPTHTVSKTITFTILSKEFVNATGYVANKSTLYSSPSESDDILQTESYVGPSESVSICWEEGNFYYIQYSTPSGYKCLYIKKGDVTNISNPVPIVSITKKIRYINDLCDIYYGPGITDFKTLGGITMGLEVNYISPLKFDNYALIEFTQDNKHKRVWINADYLGTNKPSEILLSFKQNDSIPYGLPMGGYKITQGFNDKTTNNKGHLGYDIVGGKYAKSIFPGKVCKIKGTYTEYDNLGLLVVLEHELGNMHFYSSYQHLKTIDVTEGQDIPTADFTIGEIGDTGIPDQIHLHLAVYTGSPIKNISGYCSPLSGDIHPKTFEETASKAGYNPDYIKYFYGTTESTWETTYPRCSQKRLYDPYCVISSDGKLILDYYNILL